MEVADEQVAQNVLEEYQTTKVVNGGWYFFWSVDFPENLAICNSAAYNSHANINAALGNIGVIIRQRCAYIYAFIKNVRYFEQWCLFYLTLTISANFWRPTGFEKAEIIQKIVCKMAWLSTMVNLYHYLLLYSFKIMQAY